MIDEDDDLYAFRIDAYTPKTIPMARLAEYIAALSALFGEKQNVHYQGLSEGSTVVLSRVEREAVPKVRENLEKATSPEGGEAAAAFLKLNELLRKDNADADLKLNGTNVLHFPGKHQLRPPVLGPYTLDLEKDGVLLRIGGMDKSAHAIIEDKEGNTWNFEVNRELAKGLARHLFGTPIRLKGSGRSHRDGEGNWHYANLKAVEFQVLNQETLAEAVAKIRNLPPDTWKQGIDSIAVLKSLRSEIH